MDASPKLVFVFWLGVVVVILVMRQRMLRKEHNHVRASVFWTKVLGAAMRGDTTPAPALPKRDVSGFIDAWNRLHGELREQESTGMARIGLSALGIGLSMITLSSIAFMFSCFKMKPAAATIMALSILFVDMVLQEFPFFKPYEQYFVTWRMSSWVYLLEPVPS